MNTYVVLLRGVNVGGANPVSMAALRDALEERGFADVATYIASGNVILDSDKPAKAVTAEVEAVLVKHFRLDVASARARVLTRPQLQKIVDKRPRGFGGDPDKFLSDVVFLIGIKAANAMRVFKPAEGVDTVWPGDGVIYSQRLAARRTKSRLNRIIGTPEYKSMTIRNWNTTLKLLELLKTRSAAHGAETDA